MTHREQYDVLPLEQAFSTEVPGRDPGGCPSDDELWASAAGELSLPDDEAIILHLARCSECSSTWRLAREMIPADHLAESSVVSIEERRRSKLLFRVLLSAAAAAILIGVGLSSGLFVRNETSSSPVFRNQGDGAEITASPEALSLPRDACRLQWSSGPDGTLYDVVVSDGDLEILDTITGLTLPEHTLHEEKIPASTLELFWRVTAHYPDGRRQSSPTFTTTLEDSDSSP